MLYLQAMKAHLAAYWSWKACFPLCWEVQQTAAFLLYTTFTKYFSNQTPDGGISLVPSTKSNGILPFDFLLQKIGLQFMTLKHLVQQDDLNISSLIIWNYIIPTLFTIAGWIHSTVINMLEHSLQGHITSNIDIRPELQYLCKYIPKYYNVQILLYQTQHLMQLLKWTSLTLYINKSHHSPRISLLQY